MLSKKKIKIMFHMASYEDGIGKQDLKNVRFYKNDYVRLNMLKSIVCVTVAYALILVLAAMYNLEYLIGNAVNLPYKTIGFSVLGIYLLLVGMYIFISVLVYSLKYEASRKRVQKYFRFLKYLRKYYQSDSEGEEEE